jgi:class 3 adenylate cyclase
MKETIKTEISDLVESSLDQAESVWRRVGDKIQNRALANEMVHASTPHPTHFPGHEQIEDDRPIVDEFIAMVLDMRDSSNHLNCAIKQAKVSQLERVFYETAALLPACTNIITKGQGGVTEYLGDGLLAFFRVEDENRAVACYSAYNAAVDCLECVTDIINPILSERYNLPEISVGIGMSVSKAVLTLTGQANFMKPTAFGHVSTTRQNSQRNGIKLLQTMR